MNSSFRYNFLSNIFICAVVLLMACVSLESDARVLRGDCMMRSLTVADGLSHNRISSILRDSRGFLWIGTRYGLNRYDNKELRPFSSSDIPQVMLDNDVRMLIEDARGYVWIATEESFCRYDTSTDTFRRYTYDGHNIKVRCGLVLDDCMLLGVHDEMIMKYDYALDSIVPLVVEDSMKSVRVRNIHPWGNGKLLLETGHRGMWEYDMATGTSSKAKFTDDKQIVCSALDELGNLWFSPYGNGIKVYDKDGNFLAHFTSENGLSTDIVTSVAVGKDGVYVGSEKGLDIIDPVTLELDSEPYAGSAAAHLGAIMTLYFDSFGNLYIGTVRNGLLMMQDVTMSTFKLSPPESFESCVTSFCPVPTGNIIASIDGNGIVEFDPRTNEWTPFEETTGKKVLSLMKWDDSHVLFSTYGEHTRLLNWRTGHVVPSPSYLKRITDRLIHRQVGLWMYAPDKNTIVAISDSIYFVDRRTGKVEVGLPENSEIIDGKFRVIDCTPNRVMVYRYRQAFVLDRSDMVLRELVDTPDGREIRCGVFDGDRTVYFATADHVYKLNIETRECQMLEMETVNNISSMVLDGNKLWFGASNRLFMTDGQSTVSFDNGDGVVANEFMPQAVYQDSVYIYLGGSNGMARINKLTTEEQAHRSKQEVEINLAELELNGISMMSALKGNVLEIPANDATVHIKVINKEERPFRSKMYRFYLDNFGMDRPFETLNAKLTLSQMPTGRDIYVRVSCTLPDGSWSEPEQLLVLRVAPVWWQTWWFITLALLALVAVAWVVYRSIRQRWIDSAQRHRQHVLERDVQILANINDCLHAPLGRAAVPVQTLLDTLEEGGEVSRPEMERMLSETISNLEEMQAMVDNPFGVLHPQNTSIEPIMLSARFNVWLSEQLSQFVKAQRVNSKITLDFRPEYDPGTISFNVSRMEMIVGCLLSQLVESGCRRIQVTISADDHTGQMSVVFSNASFKAMADNGTLKHHEAYLKVMYARWLAELDHAEVQSTLASDGKVETLTLILPQVKGHASSDGKSDRLHDVSDTSGGILSDCQMLFVGADRQLSALVRARCGSLFQQMVLREPDRDTLNWIMKCPPDIIVVDTSVDTDAAIELLRAIKADDDLSIIPVIVVTGGNASKLRDRLSSFGGDAYVEKPVDINVLIDLCRKLLDEDSR